jgi:hypothetical protein
MRKDIEALYQAVQRNEAHAATINAHLDLLRAGHRNARGNPALRTKLETEIAYYTTQLGALHAERDCLRTRIATARRGKK